LLKSAENSWNVDKIHWKQILLNGPKNNKTDASVTFQDNQG